MRLSHAPNFATLIWLTLAACALLLLTARPAHGRRSIGTTIRGPESTAERTHIATSTVAAWHAGKTGLPAAAPTAETNG